MHKKNNTPQRSSPRKYYHSERQPDVLIIVGNESVIGRLLDHSANGVGVEISNARVPFHTEDVINRLYVGKVEQNFCLTNLRVAHVQNSGQDTKQYIGIALINGADSEALQNILNKNRNPMSVENIANCRKDRIPLSLGQDHFSAESINARVRWIENISGEPLKQMSNNLLKPESLAGNIENYIGAVQIPVGIVGPVLVHGTYVEGYVPVPLATTEGALISSVTRGARVCGLAGGIYTHVTRQLMPRAPVFFCKNMLGAVNLSRWIENNSDAIRRKAQSVSSVARLQSIETFVFESMVHVIFSFATGDAAGQNMTTACTFVACEWIIEQIEGDSAIQFERYMIEGNHSGDKKVNARNFLMGRGISVTAEAKISEAYLKKYLRASAKDMIRSLHASEIAAARIGMVGFNINFANVIAGIFAATGQDIASVHESAAGIFKMREVEDGLQVSVWLPSLVIGTIGGGTGLPTQREALNIMNCYGAGRAFRLAEIIAATCLSLDLSTSAAIVSNEFVQAHERLGRNRPDKGLSKSDLNVEFFSEIADDKNSEIQSVDECEFDSTQGITTNILSSRRRHLNGIFRFNIKRHRNEKVVFESWILKLKSPASEIINLGIGVARLSGDDIIPGLFEANRSLFGFENSDVREIEILKNIDPSLRKYVPNIYGTHINVKRDVFAILMEDLSRFPMLNEVNSANNWNRIRVLSFLDAMVDLHATYWQNPVKMPSEAKVKVFSYPEFAKAKDFIIKLTEFNLERHPTWIPKKTSARLHEFMQSIDPCVEEMAAFPITLTHNDFNPRNLCMRSLENGLESPILFDWELSCFQNPQADLVEFLSFVLGEAETTKKFEEYVAYYYSALSKRIPELPAREIFDRILYLNTVKFALVRINLYVLVDNVAHYPFIERITKNLGIILTYVGDKNIEREKRKNK